MNQTNADVKHLILSSFSIHPSSLPFVCRSRDHANTLSRRSTPLIDVNTPALNPSRTQNAPAASRPDRIRTVHQLAFTPWTSHRPSSGSMDRTAVVPRVPYVNRPGATAPGLSWRPHVGASALADRVLPASDTGHEPTPDNRLPPAWMLAWRGGTRCRGGMGIFKVSREVGGGEGEVGSSSGWLMDQ